MSNNPSFSIKLALSTGWQAYKSNFGFLIVTFIIYAIITGVLNGAQSYLREQGSVLVAIPSVLSMIVGSLLGVGLVRIGLNLLNSEKAEYEDLLSGKDQWLSYLLGSLLVGVIAFAGFILLIIPGIYWSLKYMYVPYLIADKNLKVREAMKLSAAMTNGVKWHLIGYGFVQIGLVLCGLIALVIGLIAVLPTIWLASLSIYQQLDKSLNKQQDMNPNNIPVPTVESEYLAANNL